MFLFLLLLLFPKSFNAPANISEALAVFSFVSITIGSVIIGSFSDFLLLLFHFCLTSYNNTESFFCHIVCYFFSAWSTSPPPLFLKSIINDFIFDF